MLQTDKGGEVFVGNCHEIALTIEGVNMKGVNIGCGCSPTDRWRNYDNSWSIYVAKIPILAYVLSRLGMLNEEQSRAVAFYRTHSISYADARRRIPEADHSVDVLYSSHMLEHMDIDERGSFLKEARRVLKHGAYIRLAVPDIRHIVDDYLQSGDADIFMDATGLSRRSTPTFLSRIQYLLVGDRGHKYLYDGGSLLQAFYQ